MAVSIVSSLIQPLQNLDTLKYIDKRVSRDDKLPWVQSIIRKGFTDTSFLTRCKFQCCWLNLIYSVFTIEYVSALEKLLKEHTGRGDTFLAPQLHAASKRFNIDMQNEFPILSRLHETYYDIPTFRETLPANQPDAVGQLSQ
ncbi:hypothetical protein RYX36_010348 [Vicia faba]